MPEQTSIKRGPVPVTACAHCRRERGTRVKGHCARCSWWVCNACGWINSPFGAIWGGKS